MPFSTDLVPGTPRATRGAGSPGLFPLVAVLRSCGGAFWPGVMEGPEGKAQEGPRVHALGGRPTS